MNTTTMGLGAHVSGAAVETIKEGKGFFARLLERAIAAREAEARGRAAQYLQFLSDARLVELGMSAHDIQLMRESGKVPPTLWS